MKESTLTRRLIVYLKENHNGFWFKVHGGPYQQAGLPDIMGTPDGVLYGLEVKLPGRPHPLTELQRFTLTRLHEAGAVVCVVTSLEEVEELMSLSHNQARKYGAETF